MTITLIHSGCIGVSLPKGDTLAEYSLAYAHVLNTPERRNVPHSGPEFADAIEEVYDCAVTATVVKHLRTL